MADKRITGLPALTTISKDDVLLVVDDPAGTPTNKKISIQNFFSNVEPQITFANVTEASNSTAACKTSLDGIRCGLETFTVPTFCLYFGSFWLVF